MVAGALIILTILEVFGQDSLVVVDAGLLEGVLASFGVLDKFRVSFWVKISSFGFQVSSFELK